MAKISVPISLDGLDMAISAIAEIELTEDEKNEKSYNYVSGFFDCRDAILEALRELQSGNYMFVMK